MPRSPSPASPVAARPRAVPTAAPHRPSGGAESGVAMLIVLLVLFIVAVLMVDLALTAETARRAASNTSTEFLMDAAIEGRFHVYAAQLNYDRKANKTETHNDRWANRDDYGTFRTDDARAAEREDRRARRSSGGSAAGARADDGEDEPDDDGIGDRDSDNVEVEVEVEDEMRKFNLYGMLDEDKARREAARNRFAYLIDRYREPWPEFDVSSARAAEIRDRVVEYLERKTPVEGASGQLPVPKSGRYRILTPDELLLVKGFEDPDRGWSAEFLLYAAQDPEEVLEYYDADDPDAEEPPYRLPGLIRYLTVWSDAWPDAGATNAPDMQAWHRINLNTAERPVIESLFWDNPGDVGVAQKILDYLQENEDGSESTPVEEREADEARPRTRVIEKIEDLWEKIEGVTKDVFDRNYMTPTPPAGKVQSAFVHFSSDTFSITLRGRLGAGGGGEGGVATRGTTRQVRYIVRRHDRGLQTLLREVRSDPAWDRDAAQEDVEENL